MKRVQFLTVQELKENSIIQINVYEKILNQSIIEFQDLELSQILGKATYKRLSNLLVSGVTISGFTYSNDDTLLFEHIKPVMVYGSLLYSLSPLQHKVSNKGVQNITDANAQIGDVDKLRSNYTAKLEGYKKLLIEYMETDNDPETVPPQNIDTSFAFTGISIPDNQYNEAEAYRDAAYKTGYYRRVIY
ncbi:hypothetical protein LJ707_13365 [Mucilaginibacter sp. UR6-1]|uniref:DUF6712 family protein n=1 Tax=Mucilaginibacter sp. UR6-1 TaxID=1435643 RepID=UPI001E560C68|nr:hypothetical protein [Mucilaginibacter sp. UR6-1]MCC8409921.1 hypothetical protein [Mucilaginibacter sp. UR6-1]